MTETILYRSPRFEVTHDYVRSARDVYTLDGVQHVKLRRPWLGATAAASSGIAGLTLVFAPELYAPEIAVSLATCAAGIAVGARIGRLKLDSIVLRDGDGVIWAPYGELVSLKRAIETAITNRQRRTAPPALVSHTVPDPP